MYVRFFPRRECVPPTWRRTHSPDCTLKFGSGKVAYLWISSCLCLLSLTALLYRRIMFPVTWSELPVSLSYWGYVKVHLGPQTCSMPVCSSSLLHVSPPWPAACFCPQGILADGACACVRRPLSPSPCVVWLCIYVCGLPGPLLICPRPANGLPSDHGCLLYFCLHQLNSDRPLPPAGPNQAPAPTLSSLWRGPRAWDKRGHWGPGGLKHPQSQPHVQTLPSSHLFFPNAGWLEAIPRHIVAGQQGCL